MGSLPCGLWSGDLVTLQMGMSRATVAWRWEQPCLTEGHALPVAASRSLVAGLGSWAHLGGMGRASSPPSTPGVALRHGRGLPLMGEQELEVKAGREERSSGIYRGRPLCA